MKWNTDKQILCSACKEKPAIFKKQQLCPACYSRLRKMSDVLGNLEARYIKIDATNYGKYEHTAEILFGQRHPTFVYQPCIFRIGTTKYIPDFYDPIQNIFYEVIGSRQRFEQLKPKIEIFRRLYPLVNLELCCGDGKPYRSTKNPDLVSSTKQLEAFS